MKEVKLIIGGLWAYVTAIVVTAMLCGTAVFISVQYSQTQRDIANTQTQAIKDSANKVSDGLSNIGRGVCQTSDRQFVICSGY